MSSTVVIAVNHLNSKLLL